MTLSNILFTKYTCCGILLFGLAYAIPASGSRKKYFEAVIMKYGVLKFIAIIFSVSFFFACSNNTDTDIQTKTEKVLGIGDTITVVMPFNSGHGISPGCEIEKGATLKIDGISYDKVWGDNTFRTVYTPHQVWGGGSGDTSDRCPDKEYVWMSEQDIKRLTH